jgi:hypothetical protein
MVPRVVVLIGFSLSLFACGNSIETNGHQSDDQNVSVAEAFIDASYSFDPDPLVAVMASAEESIPSIVFYQGWAEGGNYQVVTRKPCLLNQDGRISCSITVKDDLIEALGIGFNVTDTFHLAFSKDQIVSVTTSSDDPQAYWDAQAWVEKNRPELIAQPCSGFFDGGPTPGDCVRAMVQGYKEFAASGELATSSEAQQ